MLRISYRNKLRLKKLLRAIVICLAVVLVFRFLLLVYVEPYVIYDRDGAYLDLSADQVVPEEVPSAQPRPVITNPQIIYSQDPATEKTIAEMGGYYITTDMLQDPQTVLSTLKGINDPCAVSIELKSIYGNFYYPTAIPGAPTANVDIDAVNEILVYLRENRFYMIGVIPAFSDSAFALEHQSNGLPISGGALWMDWEGCYWLDPASETVTGYLVEIARELDSLGFNEIAFSHFLFPDSNNIVYSTELSEADLLRGAIGEISSHIQGSGLTLSFVTDEVDFPADAVSGRLYFPDVDGSKVERYIRAYGQVESVSELVFLANSRDTRFEGQAQLRPLLAE